MSSQTTEIEEQAGRGLKGEGGASRFCRKTSLDALNAECDELQGFARVNEAAVMWLQSTV